MNPGDIYRPPTGGPYSPPRRPLPQSQSQNQPLAHSTSYGQALGGGPFVNPYDNPPPASPPYQPFPPSLSQQQPFPGSSTGAQPVYAAPPYGDPFRNPPEAPAPAPSWAQPEGSRHYPSMPNPPPHPQQLPLQGIPMQQISSGPLSPRLRTDSAPALAYQQQQQLPPPVTAPQPPGPYGSSPYMPDHRLSSPPPMLPHSSSSSDYPPRPPYGGAMAPGGSYQGQLEDDANDQAPLLSHAHPDVRFGVPPSQSGMSLHPEPRVRYQLNDSGSQLGGPGAGMGMGMGGSDLGAMGYDQDDEDGVNRHYGPAPSRMIRRNRTQKRVQ